MNRCEICMEARDLNENGVCEECSAALAAELDNLGLVESVEDYSDYRPVAEINLHRQKYGLPAVPSDADLNAVAGRR